MLGDKTKLIMSGIIVLLIISNVFLGFRYYSLQKNYREAQTNLVALKINQKNLEFAKLFIDKVIKAKGEIDFETRLQLEEAVRKTGDAEVLAQWQKFVGSKTSVEAQAEVKVFLSVLIGKIGS